jgi:hypothetical protein
MCEWGRSTGLEITVPAWLSHTGETRQKMVGVDSCIVEIVKALNDAGITTIASCCGHGHRTGSIVLADGRELMVTTFDQARKLDNLFPAIDGRHAYADRLRELMMRATEELGAHGLRPTTDAVASLASLLVNASYLGAHVDTHRIGAPASEER